MAKRKNSAADLPGEQEETLDLSDEIQPVPTEVREQITDALEVSIEHQEQRQSFFDEVIIPEIVSVLDGLKDEAHYRVSFSLPLSVLVAVLDLESPLANMKAAVECGLMESNGVLTPVGRLVLGGFDETAVRHKMAAAWRIAHNAQVDTRS